MKRTLLALIGATALTASSALYAAAQNDQDNTAAAANNQQTEDREMREGGRRFGGHGILRLLRALNLTEDQKASVQAILQAERPDIQPLVRRLFEIRRKLRKAADPRHFDEATVRTLAGQQGKVMAELAVLRARVFSKIFATLAPEQQAKANVILDFLRAGGPGRSEESDD